MDVNRNIIVIGASAGGVEAVPRLLSSLRAGFPAALFVTLHIPAQSESYLPKLINRQTRLMAEHPRHGTPIRPGRVYVAPPDYHLILGQGVVLLGHGPKENRHRPAIDPLFRSAAEQYGEQVAGVLLTGNLDDGVAGLGDIHQRRGLTIVQDPSEAAYPEMPRNALLSMQPDHCLKLCDIENLLKILPHPALRGGSMKGKQKARNSSPSPDALTNPPNGQPIAFVCPECQGPLWEVRNGKVTRYQCLVGHRYSLASLLEAHSEEVETALWVALRALEERINLQRRLAEQTRAENQHHARQMFQSKANENLRHAKLLKRILEKISE